MYFYITTTFAMFGLHTEMDGIAACNLQLALPSKSTAVKVWHISAPKVHNGATSNDALYEYYSQINKGNK